MESFNEEKYHVKKQSNGSTDSGKPAKPHPDFPLFPHAIKRWAKKVRGEFHFLVPGAIPRWHWKNGFASKTICWPVGSLAPRTILVELITNA